jgi:hypothetical protein
VSVRLQHAVDNVGCLKHCQRQIFQLLVLLIAGIQPGAGVRHGAVGKDRQPALAPTPCRRFAIKGLHCKAYVHVGLVNLNPYVILGAGASVPEQN